MGRGTILACRTGEETAETGRGALLESLRTGLFKRHWGKKHLEPLKNLVVKRYLIISVSPLLADKGAVLKRRRRLYGDKKCHLLLKNSLISFFLSFTVICRFDCITRALNNFRNYNVALLLIII